MYDYLVVGAGLFGATFAYNANKAAKKVLVIDKRNHIAGNIYTENVEDINVHRYGAHIFHTNSRRVWDFVNLFAEFNRFTNSPIANYKGEIYSLPFNMYTFNKMWGVVTPSQAKEKIKEQVLKAGIKEPKNLEEQAISLVGTDIYEKLIKGYTKKQWGRDCKELPAFIIKRLPAIDAYYDYKLGTLEYRSVRFEEEILDTDNFQGNAAVNYTDMETPYTRIIEHKWFEFKNQEKTVISREYSSEWKRGDEPYYPVNDTKNQKLLEEYKELAKKEEKVFFGGRLGEYKYYDMDMVIESVLDFSMKL